MTEALVIGGSSSLGEALTADLRDSSSLAIAVAFAKESALSVLDVEGWCRSGRALRFLAGTDYALTELELFHRLETIGQARCRVYHAMGPRMFHPKLYILEKDRTRIVYIGSSNFTRGGLAENVEVNVRLQAPIGTPEIDAACRLFDQMFEGEFATPLSPDFESRYRELQESCRLARAYPTAPEIAERYRVAEALFLGAYRARVAVRRWLLVVSPENFEICMRTGLWGRQREAEIRGYSPGDVFLFHVTGGRGIAAFGMFSGEPFNDPRPLWPSDRRGAFPWRIRFVPLGELRTGVATREVLAPLRSRAPRNWFHGFIQQSHELGLEDFELLRSEVEAAVRRERLGVGLVS
jgi:HKD family nuclease